MNGKKLLVLRGITAVRVKLGFTQQEFADYLDISKSLVSMVEKRKRTITAPALGRIISLEAALSSCLETREKAAPTAVSYPDLPKAPAASANPTLATLELSQLYELQYRLWKACTRSDETREILLNLKCLMRAGMDHKPEMIAAKHAALSAKQQAYGPIVQQKLKSKIELLELKLASRNDA